jgi:hypothetical protein
MMAGGVYHTFDLLHDVLGGSCIAYVLASATVEHVTHTREDGDDVLRPTGVQSRGNLLQDSWVACASHQAARRIEERIDPSDPEENSHEDHSTQCRARRTCHESAVHG